MTRSRSLKEERQSSIKQLHLYIIYCVYVRTYILGERKRVAVTVIGSLFLTIPVLSAVSVVACHQASQWACLGAARQSLPSCLGLLIFAASCVIRQPASQLRSVIFPEQTHGRMDRQTDRRLEPAFQFSQIRVGGRRSGESKASVVCTDHATLLFCSRKKIRQDIHSLTEHFAFFAASKSGDTRTFCCSESSFGGF